VTGKCISFFIEDMTAFRVPSERQGYLIVPCDKICYLIVPCDKICYLIVPCDKICYLICDFKAWQHLQCHVEGKVTDYVTETDMATFPVPCNTKFYLILKKTSQHFQGHVKDEVVSFCSDDMSLYSVPCKGRGCLIL